jgi:ADP-heptose:LPS heptosyltransferase
MTNGSRLSTVPGTNVPPTLDPAAFERVVIFFANALGDHLIALAALRALAEAFGGRFTLATARSPTELLFGSVPCARVVQMPIQWGDGDFDAAAAAASLGPTDLFISVNNWHNDSVSALLTCLAPAMSVGFHPAYRIGLQPDLALHQVDQIFSICRVFGIAAPPEAHAGPFALPEASIEFATDVRQALGDMKMLLIHGETKPDKSWPIDQMNRVVTAFLAAHPDYVALGLAKRPEQLAGRTPALIPLAGLPIASAASIVASADIFLGVDSFPLHVADLWRLPAVGLFGPTQASEWGFRFSRCGRHVQGPGCMGLLRDEDVLAALDEVAALAPLCERPYTVGMVTAPVVTLRYH